MVPFLLSNSKVSAGSALNAVCASIAALIGVIGYLAACGLQSKLASANVSMEERIVMLQGAGHLRSAAQALHDQLASARSRVESFHSRLPKGPEETQFLEELSSLASKAQLELSEFRPGSVVDRGNYKEIDLRVRTRGHYSNVCQLLAELTKVPRMVRVSQLTLSAPAAHGGECDFDVQIILAFDFKTEPSITARE